MVARNARDPVHDSDGTVVFFVSKGSRRNKHLGTRALIKGGHGNFMSKYTTKEGRRSRDNHICGSEIRLCWNCYFMASRTQHCPIPGPFTCRYSTTPQLYIMGPLISHLSGNLITWPGNRKGIKSQSNGHHNSQHCMGSRKRRWLWLRRFNGHTECVTLSRSLSLYSVCVVNSPPQTSSSYSCNGRLQNPTPSPSRWLKCQNDPPSLHQSALFFVMSSEIGKYTLSGWNTKN